MSDPQNNGNGGKFWQRIFEPQFLLIVFFAGVLWNQVAHVSQSLDRVETKVELLTQDRYFRSDAIRDQSRQEKRDDAQDRAIAELRKQINP